MDWMSVKIDQYMQKLNFDVYDDFNNNRSINNKIFQIDIFKLKYQL